MAQIVAAIVTFLASFNAEIEEPSYTVVISPPSPDFSYEVRNYGTRIAIETVNDDDAFQVLAAYIGVGTDPENESTTAMNMTAPVSEGIEMTTPVVVTESIEMTAPVVVTESIEMTA